MKKTGIAAVVLLVAGAAATDGAWYTGTQLETLLPEKIAEANQELARQLPGSEVQLSLTSLERGVFSSVARYQLDLGELAHEWPASELVLVEHIEHGPLPLSRLSTLRLLPVLSHSQTRLEETALTAPSPDQPRRDAAAQALAALQRCFAELQAVPEPTAAALPAVSDARAPDTAAARAGLRTLAAQLDSNDLAASDHFDALRPALAQRLDAPALQAMAEAIANLDYAAARGWLAGALDETEGEAAA